MTMILTKKHIHLWYIPLNIEASLDLLFPILSIDEQQKADRFYFKQHRERYILRKYALRQILSKYLTSHPKDILFVHNHHQKPSLQDNPDNLQFNMSHSNNMALLVIAKKHLIGVDLECLKPIENILNIANNFFAPEEISQFSLVPSQQKLKTFYKIWTSKEAFVKAIGYGLSCPLDTFSVPFLSKDPIKIIKVNSSVAEASKWSLTSFDFNYLNNLYIVSIVSKNKQKTIVYFFYTPSIAYNVFSN